MRRIRPILALPAVLVALVTTLGVGGPASAGPALAVAPHDLTFNTITADLNNDGIPDHATLGQVGDQHSTTCSVTVEFGRPDGTFGAAHVHTYASPEKNGPFCPSIGVAVKLGKHKKFDLVTGFPFGFQDVLVLTGFQPAFVTGGVTQPDLFRTADLAGDGRQDVIQISGQVSELATLINTRQGTLVRGPGVCAFHPQYVLADFLHRGGQDLLISAFCAIPSPQFGVSAQVVFGNGKAPVTLLSTRDIDTRYTVFAIDLNYDGIPDAGVITALHGATTVTYFQNDGQGDFTQVAGP